MSTAAINEALLDTKLSALEAARTWSPRLVSKLETTIRSGADPEVVRINPYNFAAARSVPESEAIDLFLHAVDQGLFEMDWNIVCPGCTGVLAGGHHLRDVRSEEHCPMCKMDVHTTMDDEIHVSFTVSPDIRPTPAPEPGPLGDGDKFLSGKRLITNQTFRDLFRSETVSAEEGIALKDITIIFTDLKGSTELYDAIGDPKAYYLVRQHFETLGKVVASFEGATIKTIGDAVMATFLTPLDGLKAAVGMLKGIAEFNQKIREKLILKIGIHRGQSIAVTLNERLDYFGQTVNIAARVQGLAGPGEVYITQAVYDFPGVKEYLAGVNASVTGERSELRGIAEKIQTHRVIVG
jgi:class 3 adenylate cyclase